MLETGIPCDNFIVWDSWRARTVKLDSFNPETVNLFDLMKSKWLLDLL